MIEIDLKGTIAACRAVAPLMQKQGRGSIINMGWDLSLHGLAGANPQGFAAVKAGILGFTRALARTVGPAPRVNLLAPGWIRTAFAKGYMDAAYYQARLDEIPLDWIPRRLERAAEVIERRLKQAAEESRKAMPGCVYHSPVILAQAGIRWFIQLVRSGNSDLIRVSY